MRARRGQRSSCRRSCSTELAAWTRKRAACSGPLCLSVVGRRSSVKARSPRTAPFRGAGISGRCRPIATRSRRPGQRCKRRARHVGDVEGRCLERARDECADSAQSAGVRPDDRLCAFERSLHHGRAGGGVDRLVGRDLLVGLVVGVGRRRDDRCHPAGVRVAGEIGEAWRRVARHPAPGCRRPSRRYRGAGAGSGRCC